MAALEAIGMLIRDDEPTWGMAVGEDDHGFYTRLRVVRADQIIMAEIRHGPDPEYSGKIPPMFVPSVEGEMSVGEMMEMSEAHRHDLKWYRKAMAMKANSTLIRDVINADEAARYAIRNRSSFGPLIAKQRGGYSQQTNRRDWFEERARRTKRRNYAV